MQRFNTRPFSDTIYKNGKPENFSLYNTLSGKAGGTQEQSEILVPEKDNSIEMRLSDDALCGINQQGLDRAPVTYHWHSVGDWYPAQSTFVPEFPTFLMPDA